MWLIDSLGKQPRSVVVALGALLVVALGVVDYQTGPDVSFLLFYLLPVFLVTWFAGATAGVLISLTSAVFWFVDDVIGRASTTQTMVHYWNASAKFGVFLALTLTLAALKDALERQKFLEQERLRRDIEIAREVQQRLFPQSLPRMKTLDYTGVCQPAFSVGGDYYDFLQISKDKLGIVVADVSGKGISSALLMASLQGMVRSHASQSGMSLDELIADINEMLRLTTDYNKFATLFYGVYEDSNRTLTYVNAGHNPPLVFKPGIQGCEVLPLTSGGVALGLVPHARYCKAMLQLDPDDIVVLFTDGISESRNGHGEEFGETALGKLILSNLQLSALELQNLIQTRVQQFAGAAPQHDDMTLLVLKVR